MVKHNNPTISEDASRLFNTKLGDHLGSEINPIIQPTYEIQRRCNIVRGGAAVNAASAAIYTTPTDKDFYLVGVTLTVSKDATATSTSSTLRCTIDGVTQLVLYVATTALVQQDVQLSLSLPIPIKIDRGTNITCNNATAVANITTCASIVGYTQEVTKGV